MDGDGVGDFVSGDPNGVGKVSRAGQITVVYGAAPGHQNTFQVLDESSAAVGDTAKPTELFGTSVALADVSGDGQARSA